MSVQFLESKRGKPKAMHEGYLYTYDKQSKVDEALSFYVCERYRDHKCTARIHVRHDLVVKAINTHNHAPDGTRKRVLEVMSEIRVQAATTDESTMTILANKTAGLPPAVAAAMPSSSTTKRLIQRTRRQHQGIPVEPVGRAELLIPLEFRTLENGDEFLVHDSGRDDNRFLIFSTNRLLDLLNEQQKWAMDGTFDASPSLFQQLYTIHVSYLGKTFPVLYALLPHKNEETYVRLFEAIRTLRPQVNPSAVLTDFEQASMNALRRAFPEVTLTGCFFHFCQCFWRKIQQLGHATRYKEEDGEFSTWSR